MSAFESRSQARRKAVLAERAQCMRRGSTPSEQILWVAIRGRALGVQFRRQVPIGGWFIGDFVASEFKLIVEVDGRHHVGREVADSRRDVKLQRLGFVVLRLHADTVEYQLLVALQRIHEAIAAARSSV